MLECIQHYMNNCLRMYVNICMDVAMYVLFMYGLGESMDHKSLFNFAAL